MRRAWVRREMDVPAATVWRVLTDLDQWPRWGPSVRRATLDGDRFEADSTGTVTTAVGATLRFVITEVEPGRRWAWEVGGVPATDHVVEPLHGGRSRVGFGVPWIAAPYLAVCHVALRRIERLATATEVAS